jgi:response regulator RpfG family c-di-GMP phosphodiesterase
MPPVDQIAFGPDSFLILYVDDEQANCAAFKAAFRREAEIITASSLEESLELLKTQPVDLLITDQRMPSGTGLELLLTIRGMYPDVTRVMVTAYGELQLAKTALNEGGIRWFLEKPWDPEELRKIIRQVYREGVDRDLRRIEIYELQRAKRMREATENVH